MLRRSMNILGLCALGTGAVLRSAQSQAADTGDDRAAAAARREATLIIENSQLALQEIGSGKQRLLLKDAMSHATAVLIFPRVVRAGFMVGGAGGHGILLRRDAASNEWFGPAFYTLASASLGLQAGVSTARAIMVVKSEKALDALMEKNLKLGVDASYVLMSKAAGTGTPVSSDLLVFAQSRGVFVGMELDGSMLEPRSKMNSAYYGRVVTPRELLVDKDIGSERASGLRAVVKTLSSPA